MHTLTTTKSALKIAAASLKRGGIIVVPTDTAYGLAVDPFNKKAVNKLYALKSRVSSKKIPWVAANVKQINRFFKLSKIEKKLARQFWPGPLSLVLYPNHGQKKIAVRIPDHSVLRHLCHHANGPLTATSANISGQKETYSITSVLKQFKNKKFKPDYIINAGRLKKRKPSTIIELKDDKIIMHRPGPISMKTIKKYV
ncbi:L-threonylcarbamoyladenylate synthase [Patescibacteria group bacterium]